MCKFSSISYNDSHMRNWSCCELTSPVSQLPLAFGYVLKKKKEKSTFGAKPAASAQLEAMLTIPGLRRRQDSRE